LSFKSCSPLYSVNISMAVFGASREIWRAASIPFMIGICKSSITMSGFSSLTRSTAIFPLSASPQTIQWVFCWIQERSERRIEALSSTMRMEYGTLAPVPLAGCGPGHIVQVDGRLRGRTPPPYSSNRACKYSEYCTLAYVVQPNGAHCNVLDCSFLRQLAPNAFLQQKTPQ